MLKSILSNNTNTQQYIYPPYHCDINNNQKEIQKDFNTKISENGYHTSACVKPLAEGGEHFASLNKRKLEKTVSFSQPPEENVCSKSKQGKRLQPTSSKKKALVKKLIVSASGDAAANAKENRTDKTEVVAQNGFHVKWDFASTRWAARMEHLSELDKNLMKTVSSKSSPNDAVVMCEKQAHFTIGSGPDFSSVYLGILNNNIEIAVKKINVKRVPLLCNEDTQKMLLSIPSNPHLAKIHVIARDKTHFYVVRELCENSLKREIRMRSFIPEEVRPPLDCIMLCRKIAESVSTLHKNGITHLSLKPENIFVEKSGEIKLADYFIHGRNYSKKQQYVNGTSSLCWLPSEALGNSKTPNLTMASDIASLGMIFCWLVTGGYHPFGDNDNAPDTCVKNILHGHYNLKAINDPYAHHLVQHMIFKEPEKRVTISEVLGHPYFWAEDAKVEYIMLVAKTVFCISEAKLDDHTMCNNLTVFLKSKERNILQSCCDTLALGDFPRDARCNLLSLISYIYHPMHEERLKFAKKALKALPGMVLEMYAEFSSDDLEMLLMDIGPIVERRQHQLPLQTCLSADSGVGSPGMEGSIVQDDFDYSACFPFEFDSHRNRLDSECYASTDDGIDVLSPVCGSLTEDSIFSSPVKINPRDLKDEWKRDDCSSFSSRGGYSSSVDTHFEFDRVDFMMEEASWKPKMDIPAPVSWTDMDELD